MSRFTEFEKIVLVANPTSGGGRAGRRAQRLARHLEEDGCRVSLLHTQRPGQGKELAARIDCENCLLVAVGGDGTFNELLNGADLGSHTLTVVPAGTGNVLAKELGISTNPDRAVAQLRRGNVAELDSGVCNGRRFINVFGAGIDGRVVHEVDRRRSDTLSQVHYVPYVARDLLHMPRWSIRVEVDGRLISDRARQVTVGNAHSYGGPLEMTPAADPTDGLLDVMSATVDGLFDAIGLVACCLLRSTHLTGLVDYARARRVVLWAVEDGVPYEVDGEAAGFLPATVEVRPASVRVLAPASFGPIRREPSHTS